MGDFNVKVGKNYSHRLSISKDTKEKFFKAMRCYKQEHSSARYRKVTEDELVNKLLDNYISLFV